MLPPDSAAPSPAPTTETAGYEPGGEQQGDRPAGAARALRVAIVGVPGSGKSLLFDRLSGRHARSAGYPFTTAGLRSAEVKLGGRSAELIDTPGTTGLEFCSEDEAVTRSLLHADPPDLVIQCVDADNLVRSLLLTAQLADLEIPMVVGLTMVDEALGRGQLVDAAALDAALAVPVVPVCAVDGRGVRALLDALPRAARPRQVAYPSALETRLGEPGESTRAARVGRALGSRHAGMPAGQSLWHMVNEAHTHWARELVSTVVRATGLPPRRSLWDRIGDAALHPIGAWLFLVLTIVAGYLMVSRIGVGLLARNMEQHVADPVARWVGGLTGPGWLNEVLVGHFGLLSLGLLNALCTVLPILLLFHLLFAFLEEVGYFPLLSVQFDRLLRSFGLSGRAVLPITLGFGCNSLAVMATRALESPRQRFIACFLIALGVPCAVQLGVIIAIASTMPVAALLGFVGIVVGISLLTGRLLAMLLPQSEQGEFLIELRRLRTPRWRTVAARTWRRLVDFFLELVPLFVASAAVLQLLHWTGLLEKIRQLLAPVVVTALGLPREAADVLLMAVARREVAVVMMKDMVDGGSLSLSQIVVGLTVMTLFVPCTNALLVLGRVLGGRRAALIFLGVMGTSIAVGSVMNLLW